MSAVIERVHRRARLKMEIMLPIDAFQQADEELIDLFDIEARMVRVIQDQQVLGE